MMPQPALKPVGLLAVCILLLLVTACENDLNKVKAVSAKELSNPVDTTRGVDVLYSDSAHVKARMQAPLMLRFNTQKPYYEMPKGVKVTFFDIKAREQGTITADYAITSNDDKVIELRHHVVLSNPVGDTFKSDEMTWDQNKKQVFTNAPWQLNKMDGTALTGMHFRSNETFTEYYFDDGKGDIATKGSIVNQ